MAQHAHSLMITRRGCEGKLIESRSGLEATVQCAHLSIELFSTAGYLNKMSPFRIVPRIRTSIIIVVDGGNNYWTWLFDCVSI